MVGGSPLTLFRLTDRGTRLIDRIEAGDDVGDSRLVDSLLDAGAIHPIARASHRFSPADVTVVVPTLGTPAHVPAGAIVVDDGSAPPVPGAHLRLDRNRGPAAARNAGLARVDTSLVAFVDGDVALPDDWLDGLLGHFDDDRVAIVAPRVRSHHTLGTLGSWERRNSPLDLGPLPARVRAGSRVSYVPAAVLVCRTDVLRDLGGFDESLRFGEDVDLVWRTDSAGWRCRYEPAVEVAHEPRSDWPAWIRQRIGYGSSAGPLDRRHPGALAPVRVSAWSVAVWILVVVGRPGLAVALGAGTGAALARRLPDVPARDAVALAARGNARAGTQLAAAVRRAWWPILTVLAVRSRVARRVLTAGAIAAGHPLRLADDLAYSIGLWRGIVREGTAGPLVPDLTSWPGGSRRRERTPPASATHPLPSSG